MTSAEWTQTEQEIAQVIFNRAYDREINALMNEVRGQASGLADVGDIWRLHDYLSARRHEIDGKYDYRYPALLFVFAQLVQEGWLQLDELDGLSPEKRTKVAALARM